MYLVEASTRKCNNKDYHKYMINIPLEIIEKAELKERKEITPEDHKYLGSRKEFELDKDVIIDFCDFAVKFFKEV